MFLVSGDGRKGWVDINADGSVDAWRDGDRLVVAASLVPEWASPTAWISIPASSQDPVTQAAVTAGPVKSAISPLLTSGTLGDTIADAERTMGPAHADAAEEVQGRSTIRYEFAPAHASGVSARVWIDDDHVVVRTEIVNTQNPYGSSAQRAEVVAIDQPITVEMPPDPTVTPLGHLPAGPVLLSAVSSDPTCNAPAEAAAIQSRRACIEHAALGQDLDAYTKDEENRDPVAPYGCPPG